MWTCASILILCARLSAAVKGVDISEGTSTDAFKCLMNQGFEFAIVQIYKSYGAVDTRSLISITNAHAAGMTKVDGFLFPCQHCKKTAADQANEIAAYFKDHKALLGTLWVDIEGSSNWNSEGSANALWIAQVVQALQSHGYKVGIYSSFYNWKAITGNSKAFSSLPLWYAHYDGVASFSDWGYEKFGAWAQPTIKQYDDYYSGCGIGFDLNYYPDPQ